MPHEFSHGCLLTPLITGDYTVEIESSIELRDGVQRVYSLLQQNEVECFKYRAMYLKYKRLWSQDLKDAFRAWWEEVAVVPEVPKEEVKEAGEEEQKKEEEEPANDQPKYPPLDAFEAKVHSTVTGTVTVTVT